MTLLLSKKILIIIFFLFHSGIYPIKIVELEVPSKVRKGQAIQMSCLYDLQNQSLYSLKWFYRSTKLERDEKEFFRFTPNEKPHKRQFKLPNITVDVSIWFKVKKVLTHNLKSHKLKARNLKTLNGFNQFKRWFIHSSNLIQMIIQWFIIQITTI